MEFNLLRKDNSVPGLCCLYLLPDKLIVTHALTQERTTPVITFIEVNVYKPNTLKAALRSIIKKHGFQNVACTWVLHASDYQFFLLDPPAVTEDEIPLALRWQIKELINFPAEEAAIEYFSIPAPLEHKNKMAVACAKLSVLQATANVIHDAGFQLKYIDIPELALRNITALYGDDTCYLGLLAFHHNTIELIITHEKNLLLSRRLKIPEGNTPSLTTAFLNTLIDEIQRSFTYCKSQQQKELPGKILVSTEIPTLVGQLNQLLNFTSEALAVSEKITFEFLLAQQNNYIPLDYLIAFGAALRKEDG